MRVDELMSAAKSCHQGDTVRDVARMMKEESVGFVPICDASDVPVGAVTDRDLAIRVLADGRSADEEIDAFMTRAVFTCRIGDEVRDAERLMREERRSRVMVCDAQGRLAGVMSLADIADIESEEDVGETFRRVKSDQPTAH